MPYSTNKLSIVLISLNFICLRHVALLRLLNLLLAGLRRFVLFAFLLSLLPIRALVFFKVIRFFMLIGAEHCAGLLTTLPFLLPLVQRTARLIFLPLLRQT